MFQRRQMRGSRGSNFTTLSWASAAVLALAGCDDTVRLVVEPDQNGAGSAGSAGAPEPSPPEDAASGGQAIAGGAPNGASVEGGPNVSGLAGGAGANGDAGGCWQLPVVDGARVLAPSGRGADLVGGKIVGSLTSPTNGFVDLAVIEAAPADGEFVELTLSNATAYRYVKYYSPGGSYGVVAEVELYAGAQKLTGAAFGTAGSRDDAGTVFANALDGDPSTFFEGPLPNDNYVGLDLGDGHELAPPTFSPAPGSAEVGTLVTLSAEAGASISYTTDGSDPVENGTPYSEGIPISEGSTLVRAVATGSCALPSDVAQAVYVTPGSTPGTGSQNPVQSSLHIGNSLTDTINDRLQTVAADGGIALDYNRYTIPGAGTWMYDQNPTGGFGLANVQETLRTRPFDHLSMQPYPNQPCQAVPSSEGDDSDSGYVAQAWADAMTQNPNVQLWVYQQWPLPADITNCMSGGGWTRGDWDPPAPQTWEDAVANELTYHELIRSTLISQFPDAPPPYIVPGGLALVALKRAVEQGEVPGITDFFGTMFLAGGDDIHLTSAGAYLITLVFYASMFQQSPEGLINESSGELTDEQAAVFQRIAWETVLAYPLSGVSR